MRLLSRRSLLPLAALVLTAGDAVAQPDRMSGLSVRGIPHPASAALHYRDSLRLDERQAQALRVVIQSAERALYAAYSQQIFDSAGVLLFWSAVPIDSVTEVRRMRTRIEQEVGVTMALLRARDETFRVLTGAQRAKLDSLFRGTPTPEVAARVRSCDTGSSGGSLTLSDRAKLVYSVSYEGDSARLHFVAVALAESSLHALPTARRTPFESDADHGGGGSAGAWMIVHAPKRDAVMVDTMQVNLNGGNVVLVRGVDRLMQPPDIVAVLSVPSMFHTAACRDRAHEEALREHVLASKQVREFLAGGDVRR
jgi:hypothetical protein